MTAILNIYILYIYICFSTSEVSFAPDTEAVYLSSFFVPASFVSQPTLWPSLVSRRFLSSEVMTQILESSHTCGDYSVVKRATSQYVTKNKWSQGTSDSTDKFDGNQRCGHL